MNGTASDLHSNNCKYLPDTLQKVFVLFVNNHLQSMSFIAMVIQVRIDQVPFNYEKRILRCVSLSESHVVASQCVLLLRILFHLLKSKAVLIKDSVQTNCFIKGMIQWYQEEDAIQSLDLYLSPCSEGLRRSEGCKAGGAKRGGSFLLDVILP